MNKHNFEPRITVITSVLNGGKYLEDTIISIIKQSYKNIEYIIIDGGSSDNTVSIIEKYTKNISYWISEPDYGIYDAWNKGLKVATGDWIAFLGSDDVYLENAVSDYVDIINSSSIENLEFISSKVSLVDNQLNVKRVIGKSWNWKDFKKYMNVVHVGSMHSKRLFQRLGEYNHLEYKIVGDYEFLLRAGKHLNAAYLDDITVLMRIGGISNSVKVYDETYLAKVKTAQVFFLKAYYEKIIALIKFYIRKFIIDKLQTTSSK